MKIHLDTNALVVEPNWTILPDGRHELAISALVYAEFSEGIFSANPDTAAVTARRLLDVQDRYGYGVAFDGRAARIYASICTAAVAAGRRVGRKRRMDFMIAAVAAAHDAAILTHNVSDFSGLQSLVPIFDARRK